MAKIHISLKKNVTIYKLLLIVIIVLLIIFVIRPICINLITAHNIRKLNSSLMQIDTGVKTYYYRSVLNSNHAFDEMKYFVIKDKKNNTDLDLPVNNAKNIYIALYNNGIYAICIDNGGYFVNRGVSGSSFYGRGVCHEEYNIMLGEYKVDN